MQFEQQQYQQDCIDNIVYALSGVDFAHADYSTVADKLAQLAHRHITYRAFEIVPDEPRLDVLMETGTGKTFVYLQTILELNRCYKQNKFIIVLPRTAIKEGVLQNIKLTDSYFFNLYHKHINIIDYPKDGLGSIRNTFINSSDLCVLLTTNSAFNKEKNNINKKTESLFQYGSTWNGIAAQRPIVIIDEPHLLTGTQTQKGLGALTHSLIIRFGATFPDTKQGRALSNVVYMLDSINAFNQYLVKQIGVSTVYAGAQQRDIAISNIKVQRKCFDLYYCRDGYPHQATIRIGDDIGATSGLTEYSGVSPTKITTKTVFLSNKTTIPTNIAYALSEDEMRLLVRETITHHFEKEQYLFEHNIKALTLFFIPAVADFRGDSPRVKHMFEEEYHTLRKTYYEKTDSRAYRAYLDNDHDQHGVLRVHQGYFAGDKGSEEEKERAGVAIILKHKEQLLSLDEPLRFVFSVVALQEGWDNPNIFTICKLAGSKKETTRRQQVGRGLRIAVNQRGKRLTINHLQDDERAFYDINRLDMVVSGQEQSFIYQIQHEINRASYGFVGDTLTLEILKGKGLHDIEAVALFHHLLINKIIDNVGVIQSPIIHFLRNNRTMFSNIDDNRYAQICKMFEHAHQTVVQDNNRKKQLVNIRADRWKDFQQLWEQINRTATIVYRDINESALIDSISETFNGENITPLTATVERDLLNTQRDVVEHSDSYVATSGRSAPLDMGVFAFRFMSQQKERLPQRFITDLFSKLNRQQFINNPALAEQRLRTIIKDAIHDGLLHSIDYDITTTVIYPNTLQDKTKRKRHNIESTQLGKYCVGEPPQSHYLYDTIVYDSEIEKYCMQHDPQHIDGDTITVFAKLPQINIPTPYKSYNPDFAYLIGREGKNTLFLIVETKGYDSEGDIPQTEKHKINYARKFFECLNNQLPDIDVVYKTRINRQQLSDVVRGIVEGEG